MARASRAKGVAGEHEVAAIYTEHGFEVRGLEGRGDHLAIKSRLSPVAATCFTCSQDPSRIGEHAETLSLFSEVKRQERLQLWQWLAQAQSEAPAGTVPVVSFRRNRGQWYACLPLRDLLRLV